MKTIEAIAPLASPAPVPNRYQVFRQAKTGVHYNHGSSIASADEAVQVFLETAPLFEGGGVRLGSFLETK